MSFNMRPQPAQATCFICRVCSRSWKMVKRLSSQPLNGLSMKCKRIWQSSADWSDVVDVTSYTTDLMRIQARFGASKPSVLQRLIPAGS